jgi:hypothetical protein
MLITIRKTKRCVCVSVYLFACCISLTPSSLLRFPCGLFSSPSTEVAPGQEEERLRTSLAHQSREQRNKAAPNIDQDLGLRGQLDLVDFVQILTLPQTVV